MLGQAVIATKGYGADEVERIYMRARELSQQVDETTHVFPVMYGLWVFHYIRAEFRTAHELGLDILRLAQRQDEEVPLLVAHRLVGTTLVFLGQFSEAEAHLEQALSLYDRQRHRVLARQYSQDIGVAGLSFLSWTRWMVGYPDQALARAHEALALARNIAHPFSLAFALNLVARVYCFRRETNAAHEIAKAAVTLCQEQGLGAWLGSSIRYLTLTARQPDEEAIFQVYQGRLELVDNARAYWLAMLAQAYEKREQAEVGLHLLSEALADVSETDAHFLEAELYRLKGELLLSSSSDNATESGTCFHKAIAIAQSQSAKSWELRAATSLARLWQQQGKRQEAHDLLAPVYEWFTEGFDTADLKDAKALLDELGDMQKRPIAR
jgi:predicted ATPase